MYVDGAGSDLCRLYRSQDATNCWRSVSSWNCLLESSIRRIVCPFPEAGGCILGDSRRRNILCPMMFVFLAEGTSFRRCGNRSTVYPVPSDGCEYFVVFSSACLTIPLSQPSVIIWRFTENYRNEAGFSPETTGTKLPVVIVIVSPDWYVSFS